MGKNLTTWSWFIYHSNASQRVLHIAQLLGNKSRPVRFCQIFTSGFAPIIHLLTGCRLVLNQCISHITRKHPFICKFTPLFHHPLSKSCTFPSYSQTAFLSFRFTVKVLLLSLQPRSADLQTHSVVQQAEWAAGFNQNLQLPHWWGETESSTLTLPHNTERAIAALHPH